jgi:hypothetical protein
MLLKNAFHSAKFYISACLKEKRRKEMIGEEKRRGEVKRRE